MAKVKTTTKKKSTTVAKKKTASKKAASKKAASKETTEKLPAKASKKKVSSQEIELMNETGRRRAVVAPKVERRKRRRQIDPTTCEREYSDPEIEFMHAMDEYKRASGRMFPTCSEILEVMHRLGYRQIEPAHELMYDPKKPAETEEEKWNNDNGDVEGEE